ncbi:hypothetical protein VTJ04DRAFT_5786 [Mycothermus thermophilus]|uniref:uncharacterized protein n=1 Tax=Humicola insolens TaxID=85995 RepID=UPI00374271C5
MVGLIQIYPTVDSLGSQGASIGARKSPTIDIVFVHGLEFPEDPAEDGQKAWDGRRTWTAEDGTCWPEHMLPNKIPESRIFCFAYNGSIMGTTCEAGVRDYANVLLRELSFKRANEAERFRPLIFVGHSLGGNIIKRALYLAHCRNIKAFVSVTVGIIFFSTPHFIPQNADVREFGRRILEAAGSRRNSMWNLRKGTVDPTNEMMQEFEENSRQINDMTSDFLQLLHEHKINVKVHNFREEWPMPGHSTTVVDHELARLGEAEAEVLDGNHNTVCKITNDALGQSKFEAILAVLNAFARTAAHAYNSTILDYLDGKPGSMCPSSKYQANDNIYPTEGTCAWIEERPQFVAWMTGSMMIRSRNSQGRKLWISGKLGSGKTYLARHIITKIHSQTQDLVLECFLKAKRKERDNCDTILKATLEQLARYTPELHKQYSRMHPANGKWSSKRLRDVWLEMMVSPVCNPQRNITIIIDGFDEILDEEQKRFLDLLLECEKARRLCSKDPDSFRILILSRPCRMLAHNYGFTKYEIKDEDTRTDIRLTVTAELAHSANTTKLPETVRQMVCDLVTNRASGSYLWSSLAVSDIRMRGVIREEELRDHLEKLPREIAGLYDSILSHIHGRGELVASITNWVLLWVVFCIEPLTLAELREALKLTRYHYEQGSRPLVEETLRDKEVTTAHGFKRFLANICGPLLRLGGGEMGHVDLVHQSLSKFLTSSPMMLKRRGFNFPAHDKFFLKEGPSHAKLGRLCVDYLTMDVFQSAGALFTNDDEGRLRWETKVSERIETYHLARYAALSWLIHMRLAGPYWQEYSATRDLIDPSTGYSLCWREVWWFVKKWGNGRLGGNLQTSSQEQGASGMQHSLDFSE